MQVVIDTNIIISAFLPGQGSCRLFMDQVFAGQHEVIVSETIMREYEIKLRHPKFGFQESTVKYQRLSC